MKKYFYFLVLIIFSNLSFGQMVKQEWKASYDGTGGSVDYGKSIAVDNQGNVYVAGSSMGNGSEFDFVTIKYNSAGEEQWCQRYDGTSGDTDYVSGLAVNNVGDVFITGNSKNIGSSYDYVTIKYNSEGIEQWVRIYNGTDNGEDGPTSIVIDDRSNVFITGWSMGKSGEDNFDIATIKYDSDGNIVWISRYAGERNCRDAGNSIAIDTQGNAYVVGNTGFIYGSNSDKVQDDLLLIKYDAYGEKKWERKYNGTFDGSDDGINLIIDHDGNICVTGVTEVAQVKYSHSDYITIKYNSDGEKLWEKMYKRSQNSGIMFGTIIPMAIDKDNNIFISGWGLGHKGNNSDDYFTTIKYDASGMQQWVQSYNGADNLRDGVQCIQTDPYGNLYVAGYTISNATKGDYLIVKYNSSGDQEWIKKYNGALNASDQAMGMVLDTENNLYVTGSSMEKNVNYNIATIKYSQFIRSKELSQKLFDALDAYKSGNYILVLELLKDFPLDDPSYFEILEFMRKSLEKIPSYTVQNFVTVSGRIMCNCNKAISGYIVFEDLISKATIGRCRIAPDGYYCIVLPSGKKYSYYIDSKDFYPSSRVVDFSIAKQNPNHIDNINIVSYEEMKEKQLSIRINNIFFDFNESKLKPESYPELNRLYNYLSENSEIKVEISGHTDNIGTDEYNINLSNARAKTVKDYLVEKGISSARIVSNGYGKSNPVATNATDEGRQMNRRVEFKIIK